MDNFPIYAHPVQVRFLDQTLTKYIGGIVFNDTLVALDTGEALPLKILYNWYTEKGIDMDDAIVELSWEDLSDACLTNVPFSKRIYIKS